MQEESLNPTLTRANFKSPRDHLRFGRSSMNVSDPITFWSALKKSMEIHKALTNKSSLRLQGFSTTRSKSLRIFKHL